MPEKTTSQPVRVEAAKVSALFESCPDLRDFSQCCNEYLEARDLMDIRVLGFFEKTAVVLALLKIDVRRMKVEEARKANALEKM